MRISSGSCPMFHGRLVSWTGEELEKAISRKQCFGAHPAHTHRDPARSGFHQATNSAFVVTPSWLHGGISWALPCLPCPPLPHPSCSFLHPSPCLAVCPAPLAACLLHFPSPPMAHSSFSPPLPVTPAPASFLSHTLPFSHILIASPHTPALSLSCRGLASTLWHRSLYHFQGSCCQLGNR